MIQDGSFARLKTSFPVGVGNVFQKRGTKRETKAPQMKHMSRPKLFYLGLPNFVAKLVLSNVCGLPFKIGVSEGDASRCDWCIGL